MQNLIPNSMQPKIQEAMSGRTGSGPGQSLASAASYRVQPSMAQARSPCPITENVFWTDARPIEVGALFCLRERKKSHLTPSTNTSAAGCACAA
jgi:hypothetical protein